MKNLWIAIAIVVVLGGGYWWWQSQQTPALSDDGTPAATDAMDDMGGMQATTSSTQKTAPTGGTTSAAPMSATVTFNGSSFSPSTVTVAQGGTVTFTSTAGQMWVASNPHPVHTGYDGTSRNVHCAPGYSGAAPFDQCASGTSFSFTFNKTGSWGYHDHLSPQIGGTVVVQ